MVFLTSLLVNEKTQQQRHDDIKTFLQVKNMEPVVTGGWRNDKDCIVEINNLNPYKKSKKHEKNLHERLFARLIGYGDYDILIYKFLKTNNHSDSDNIIHSLMSDAEVPNDVWKRDYGVVEEWSVFAWKYHFSISVEDDKKNSINDRGFEECELYDLEYKKIDINELVFTEAFGHTFSELKQDKMIYDNGNFYIGILEFEDCYYVIDYFSS